MGIIIKVGLLSLTEARNESLPQEFAAWHQTVRIAPGTYDVFAYLEGEGDGAYRVEQLSASCEGITVSSNFRAHMLGTWGKSDNNCDGQPATAHVRLPTFGSIDVVSPLLAQAALCDALVRTEWDPREIDPRSASGKMWRFTWNSERKPIVIERSRHGGGLSLVAFEDERRFLVDDMEMCPGDLAKLEVMFLQSLLHDVDQLTVGEVASCWSWRDKQSRKVTRLA